MSWPTSCPKLFLTMHLDAYAQPSSVTYAASSGRNAAAFCGVKIACLNELGSSKSAKFSLEWYWKRDWRKWRTSWTTNTTTD